MGGDAIDLKDLDALANAPLTVTVGGRVRYDVDGGAVEIPLRTLYVTEIRVAEFSAMLRACETVFEMIAALDVRAAMLRDPDAVINVITVGSRLPRSEIEALALDELLRLGAAVLQVNADFFVHRLAPLFVEVSARVTKVLGGSTLLHALSGQDSPPTT